MRLEREDASFLGSLALNYGATGLVFVGSLVAGVALTVPDVPVVTLFAISVGISLFAPVVGYPFAKTTWAAIDYLGQRSRS